MAETGMASDASRARVFISYSREDSAFAGRLALILADRGFEATLDREDVDAGENWKERVRPLILSSDLVIVLLTTASATQDPVRWESDLAAGSGKRIIVVVPAPLEEGITLSQPISASQWFHFYKHPTRSDSGIYAGPALENALKADLPWRREYTRLFLLAEKWKDSDGADDLLRGDALTAALTWRASMPRGEILVPGVMDFLDASETEARKAEPAGAFESRLIHLEERRAAAEEAARAKIAAVRAKREDTPAAARILTPTQLANLPLAPVQAPSSLESSRRSGGENVSTDDAPDNASPRGASGRKPAKGKSLVVPALIALVMFTGAGAVVWQFLPQYLTSSGRAAAADPAPAAATVSEVAPITAANATEPEAPSVAVAETSDPASTSEASPAPAPAASERAAASPAAAASANVTPDEADWLAAREVGNISAYRTYMLKWPKGKRYEQALSAVRRRIETLSTKPESTSVVLAGPLPHRELPTFRDKGATEGAAGQEIKFVDRIASPVEGEWLVLEREGAWPFRFVSAREIEGAKQ